MSVAITIRKLALKTHYALKTRAQRNGRSAESEARAILELVLNPPQRLKIGSTLAAFGKKHGGIDLTIARSPAQNKSIMNYAGCSKNLYGQSADELHTYLRNEKATWER